MKERQLKSIRAEALKVILLAQNMDRAFGDDDEQQREHLILAIMAAISDAYHNGIKKGRMEAQESATLAKEYVSTEDTIAEHQRKSALGEGVHVPKPKPATVRVSIDKEDLSENPLECIENRKNR